MNYRIKREPEVVYYMETVECTIEDENGVQSEIRVSHHTNGTDFFILEDGIWKEIIDKELKVWILIDLHNEEVQK